MNSENWPATVEEAVTQIIAEMAEDDKDALRKMEKDGLFGLHFGFGTYVRNRCGLNGDNEALMDAVHGDDYRRDPDHVSMLIIEAVWDRLRNG